MLILEANLARNMTDEHFISALHCDATIMRTPIEIELIRRLESALDRLKPLDGFGELIEDYNITAAQFEALCEAPFVGLRKSLDDITKVLRMLNDAEINDLDDLEQALIDVDLLTKER
jgi:hypothetical protein